MIRLISFGLMRPACALGPKSLAGLTVTTEEFITQIHGDCQQVCCENVEMV